MNFKTKIPTFIFGLSIGLIIGVGVFLFKITDIFNSLKNAAKEQITIIQQPNEKENTHQKEENTNKERFKIKLPNSAKVNYKEVDSLIKNSENINVATDELLSVRTVKIIKILENHNSKNDTLSELQNKNNNEESCSIEFWKTPLNSRGYRFTKNKVMLYGFVDFNNVIVYELNENYYLKSNDLVFKITYTTEFSALQRVVDNDLLVKIN
ncbi:MAG: hypothetical protein JSU07_12695 [Bacteroidetes bacterium]|nr:hypothetical protein [Bacteroidota bacterium]